MDVSIQHFGNIHLDPGDKVVAITWFRDHAIVVTERGMLYRIDIQVYP